MFALSLAPRALRLGLLALLAPCAIASAQETLRTQHHDVRLTLVADGLTSPWSVAFLPGGDLLVTQRTGQLRVIRRGKLLPDTVPGLPPIRVGGQGGLLDVVAHPKFAENRFIYLSYSKPSADGTQGTTAVIRARLENDRLTQVTEIFEAQKWSRGMGHYGSRLAFDRDGYLFISLGDRQVMPAGPIDSLLKHPAQNLGTHHGKIIRLHDDGRVPSDNPFVNTPGALPQIWSYGHRNVQGLAVHPVTNQLWADEHGPQGGDELNLVQAGKNYGWPVIGFGVNYRTGSAIHIGTSRAGMESPINVWVPSIGISGLAIYTGDKFPQWQGHLFVGGLVGERVTRVALDGAGTAVKEVEHLVQGRGRIRDVRQGPDGFLYLVFETRQGGSPALMRLEPAPRR